MKFVIELTTTTPDLPAHDLTMAAFDAAVAASSSLAKIDGVVNSWGLRGTGAADGRRSADGRWDGTERAPDDMDVHTFFNLTYSNYLVLHRTLLQSMPVPWQLRFVAAIREMEDAFDHVPMAYAYNVSAVDQNNRFVSDPVPHYDRGRAHVEPKLRVVSPERPRGELSLARDLHAGGITVVARIPRSALAGAIQLLTSCHPHVFVVDQAFSAGDHVDLGLSPRGLACLAASDIDILAQADAGDGDSV